MCLKENAPPGIRGGALSTSVLRAPHPGFWHSNRSPTDRANSARLLTTASFASNESKDLPVNGASERLRASMSGWRVATNSARMESRARPTLTGVPALRRSEAVPARSSRLTGGRGGSVGSGAGTGGSVGVDSTPVTRRRDLSSFTLKPFNCRTAEHQGAISERTRLAAPAPSYRICTGGKSTARPAIVDQPNIRHGRLR